MENPLPSGAQSFHREDNALLPLSGLRSSVFYEPSLPLQQRIAQRAKKTLSLHPWVSSRLQNRAPRGAKSAKGDWIAEKFLEASA